MFFIFMIQCLYIGYLENEVLILQLLQPLNTVIIVYARARACMHVYVHIYIYTHHAKIALITFYIIFHSSILIHIV